MAKIAILTNFQEFHPGYSLTGIVLDQAKMLGKYGNDVTVFVNERYRGGDVPGVKLAPAIPFVDLIDYASMADITVETKVAADKTTELLTEKLADTDYVFTHDFVFTGWNLPYGLACRAAGKALPDIRWFHWVHSIPSGKPRDWWDINAFPQGHKLIYPNETDRIRIAEHFRGTLDDVRVIPHIRDIRSYFEFCQESLDFMNEFPNFVQADMIQVYPCSTDRLEAKRLDVVIEIFAKLKLMGYSTFLVVANQWATTLQRREDIEKYIELAKTRGLVYGKDLAVTSLWRQPCYETGIPRHFLRELFQCANLFVFPTREETFGLVLPEAALASGCLCVLNKSLQMQMEISGYNALAFDFGSYDRGITLSSTDEYYGAIAAVISARFQQDEGVKLKTYMRQRYNYDYLYRRYYMPLMTESQMW